LFRDEHDKSEYHLNRASELNPNDDLIMVEIGRYHMYAGQPMEGARLVRLAMQRNPFFPNWYWNILGRCLHTAQNYDEAILAFSRISTPLFFNHVYLAACHAELGNQLEAEKHVQYVMEMNPEFTIKRFAEQLPYRNEDVLRSFLDGLRKADFPSGSG